ncbi:Uu.00g035860.m01.CDS01 [Anthostomella pinea]|uniref:Uu.00g035860.m01.CDS01 n=1 Tax=Anthostomella pinea TaxID=933095 RepID=A0AAI8YDM5_9PEZI|nr:Uu.00g035860.m01.CDS01 [Anthostomella pinea]
MAASDFRVIIMGGGPEGLAAANMLAAADIDFVVLERAPAIVSDTGAIIMLWPQGTRVLHQLGLLQPAEGRFMSVRSKTTMTLDGRELSNFGVFDLLEKNHGYPCANFPRPLLTEVLYEGLGKRKSKVRTGVSIEDIETTDGGVLVHLQDGSVERGSIVIGADGVHSVTRSIMRRLAKESTGEDFDKTEKPILSPFQVLYGRASYIKGLPKGVFFETHGTNMSSQMSAGDDSIHFGLFRRLPGSTSKRKEYSDEEVAEFVEAFADVVVMPNLKFKDLWPRCQWTRLVNQHEGLMEHWYHDRIVLLGDSAVQMTSAGGMGLNNALQSAVYLVNKLHEVVQSNSNPAKGTLTRALADYQDTRREESRRMCNMSYRYIRANTWESWLTWFLVECVFPTVFGLEKTFRKFGETFISRTRVLSFVKMDDRTGAIPWAR